MQRVTMVITADSYNFLDKQLADLLLRLCSNEGHTLSAEQKAQLVTLARHTSAATRNGIIAVPLAEIADSSEGFPYTVDTLKALSDLPVVGLAGEYAPLIIEGDYVWLNRYWQYEKRLADSLQQRLNTFPLSEEQADSIRTCIRDWHYLSASTTDEGNIDHDQQDWQQRAVAMAAYSRFLVISGGPGTGKTTTVIRLLWLLIEQMQVNPQRILLAAPTGKAAMRLQESIRQAKTTLGIQDSLSERIPEKAVTLHRLLGFIPGRVSFRHHQHHPLAADVVIIDEASMIDISLMTHLFEAVSPHARLILLGDKDQLSAVETGSIFRDLCAQADNQYSDTRQQQLNYLCSHTATAGDSFTAETPPVLNDHIVVLQKSWRFDVDSGIGQLAAAVRDGQEERLKAIFDKEWDDIEYSESGSLDMQRLLTAWGDYLKLAQQSTGAGATQCLPVIFSAFNRFRILTPLRKGSSSTEQLNARISEFMRRQHNSSYQVTDKQWFVGRPVMVTQNDYRQNLFNGDIGLTLADSSGQLRVWFADQEGFRAIAPVRLSAHETAWCMTIHKSQGSEFDEVLLILPENEDIPILGRELLYTGITRAKKKIGILGKLRVIRHAMQQTLQPSSRIYSRLMEQVSEV